MDGSVKAKLEPESEEGATKAGIKEAYNNSAANLESNVKNATIELSDIPYEVMKKSGLLCPVLLSSSLDGAEMMTSRRPQIVKMIKED